MDSPIDVYSDSAKEYARSRIGTEDRAKLAKLRSYLPAGAKVLDVGCAAGRDTRILKDIGLDPKGSDLAEKLLDIARRQNPDIDFVLADMRKLPFADASFDAVWASAVLHHVPKSEMPNVLKEFRRIIVSGGIVYIHTKAGKGLMRTSETSVKGAVREFELVTADELDKMLSGCGFDKLSLELRASGSRKDVAWVNAFYRKTA